MTIPQSSRVINGIYTIPVILSQLPPNKWVKVDNLGGKGAGSLQAKLFGASGLIKFALRYQFNGRDNFYPIGIYDPLANGTKPTVKGISLEGAVVLARAKSSENQQLIYNLGTSLADKSKDSKEKRRLELQKQKDERKIKSDFIKAEKQKELEQEKAKHQTLKCLINTYLKTVTNANTLTNDRSLLLSNLEKFRPDLLSKKANEIQTQEFSSLIFDMLEADIRSSASLFLAKLKSIYNRAPKIDLNDTTVRPEEWSIFDIKMNPLAEIKPIKTEIKKGGNPLSLEELRIYWNLIKNEQSEDGAMLRIHLLSGSVRMEQLVRAKIENVSTEPVSGLLAYVLEDDKGKKDKVNKLYANPLIKILEKDIEFLTYQNYFNNNYLFSIDKGISQITGRYLADQAKKIVGKNIEKFCLSRVRSGLVTYWASVNEPEKITNRIQNHGIKRADLIVQKHYNAYDYLKEKKEVLDRTFSTLNAPIHLKILEKAS